MRVHSFRFAVALVASVGLFVAAATATATSLRKAPANRVVLLQVYAGPMAYVNGASVSVTDATGAEIASGKTVRGGGAQLVVSELGTRPYTVTTSGGTVLGKPFAGHLQAVIAGAGRRKGPQPVNFVTTVAAQYRAQHGGSAAAIEARVYGKVGLSPKFGSEQLRFATRSFGHGKLIAYGRKLGGYDAVVELLVARLADGRRFPSFASAKVQRPTVPRTSTRQSYSATAVASAPCTAQTLPPSSVSQQQSVALYSSEIAIGAVSAIATKDPSLLLNGVAGMVFSSTPGMTTSSMLVSLQAQLACISQQIAQVQLTLDNLTLLTVLNPLQNCVSRVTTAWGQYQYYVQQAALNPGDPDWALTADNPMIVDLMTNYVLPMNQNCASIINQTLFNSSGGSQPAWPTIVSNYQKGVYVSSDTAALASTSVQALQLFLQYYGTLEYEQAALMTDYYNWLGQTNGKSYQTSQMAGWGVSSTGTCVKPASLTDAQTNSLATTWCQWQQNIVDVWPGDMYSDEVGGWKQTTSTSPFNLSGIAVSAVPGSWGTSTTGYTNSPTSLTPQAMGTMDLKPGSSKWTAANTLASYNNQPQNVLAAPYQSFNHRRVSKTSTVPSSSTAGYSALGPYFSAWLDAKVSSSGGGTLTPCTSSCQQWLILTSDSQSYFTMASGSPLCTDLESNRSVKPLAYGAKPWLWTGNGTGMMQSAPCNDKTTPTAWLVSRPWTQGGTWPAAPVITTTGTVQANATLAATGCPTGGCFWNITSGAPAGLTISTGGQLSWSGSAPGTTATIQVVAGGAQAFSAPVNLTVQLT